MGFTYLFRSLLQIFQALIFSYRNFQLFVIKYYINSYQICFLVDGSLF